MQMRTQAQTVTTAYLRPYASSYLKHELSY